MYYNCVHFVVQSSAFLGQATTAVAAPLTFFQIDHTWRVQVQVQGLEVCTLWVSRAVRLLVKTKRSRGVKDLSVGVIIYSYLDCHGTSRKVLTARIQLKPNTAPVSGTLRDDCNSRREQYSRRQYCKVINGALVELRWSEVRRTSTESTYLRRAYLSTKTPLCHFEALHQGTE